MVSSPSWAVRGMEGGEGDRSEVRGTEGGEGDRSEKV